MKQTGLRTGELAAQAGVNVETIRFYERRGLIQEPRRRSSGYREYPAEAVKVVRFIKRAQELGFTLREVQELLRLRDSQAAGCADVRAAASAKMKDIDRKIDTLRAMRGALEVLLDSCTRDGSTRECPILEAIERTDRKVRRA